MKQITLILLLVTAYNTSTPMAKTKMAAKPSAAMAVATAKLQAKPIVFFDIADLTYEYSKEIKEGKLSHETFVAKSVEANDIANEIRMLHEELQFERDDLNNKLSVLLKKLEGGDITHATYTKESKPLYDALNSLHGWAGSEIDSRVLRTQKLWLEITNDIPQKFKICAKAIALKKGAYAAFEYNSNSLWEQIFCVDKAYDITDEVIDTLNKEYKESQSKKHACTHCCHAHCPKTY